jgi:PAS domain S-box-containing protein
MFNHSAERVFGWSREEILGKPLDILLPRQSWDAHHEHIRRFGREGAAARMMSERAIVSGIRKNGEEFPAEAGISKLDQADGTVFTVILRDTTATRRLQQNLRHVVERFRFLAESGDALTASLAAGDYLVRMVERVTELAVTTIADCAVVELRVATPLVRAQRAGGTWIENVEPFLVTRLGVHRPLLIEETGEDWWRMLAEDHPIANAVGRPTSAILAPISSGGQRVGALMLLSGPSRRYDDADLQGAIDLAARMGLALENRRLYEAERTAIRAREEVLGIVAHDLRSPLGAVQHGADILSTLVPEDRREATRRVVEAIQRSIRRARRLVDDLLDVARIEAGKLTMAPTPVAPDALVRAVIELYTPVAAQACVSLDAEVSPGLPPVFVDEDRIHQVLSNLVDNALKFTPGGGRVRLVVGQDSPRVRFSVVDSGAGIPPEHLAHLFDRFWQASSNGRGAGLGLAIAKGIVEAHGGRLTANSAPGQGSTFSFTVST